MSGEIIDNNGLTVEAGRMKVYSIRLPIMFAVLLVRKEVLLQLFIIYYSCSSNIIVYSSNEIMFMYIKGKGKVRFAVFLTIHLPNSIIEVEPLRISNWWKILIDRVSSTGPVISKLATRKTKETRRDRLRQSIASDRRTMQYARSLRV